MKIGFNLLLWTTHVTEADFPLLPKLKAAGYDGVELPVFDPSDLSHFARIGQVLKDEGLLSSTVTVAPDEERNPISELASHRQGAVDHLKRVLDASAEAGADILCGPYYQVLAQFSGAFPTDAERERAAEVHRAVAAHAGSVGITCAIEPLNRFESHLLNTMDDAAAYVARVGHPAFKTMYDTFHANIEEKDPIAALERNFDAVAHIHISENDRGTPGEGHTPIRQTIQKAKSLGYDGWLTIEAFGAALPDLAAATKVWRDFFPSREHVYENGIKVIREAWGS
jgi:D-psicose/D-tagatose/L-ribulose 3-epimerase